MTLTEMVQQYIIAQPDGFPIFIDDIVYELNQELKEDEKKIRQNVTVICSRLLNKLEGFSRFDVGIYYYIRYENGSINHDELTRQLYLEDKQGDIFGLLVGNSLAFHYGLSDERDEISYIMTNNWRRAQKCGKEEPIKLSAPHEEITNKNVHYFEVLELIKWNPQIVEKDCCKAKLLEMVKEYDIYSIRLMAMAVSYYNQKVVLAVAKLAPTYLKQKYPDSAEDVLQTK